MPKVRRSRVVAADPAKVWNLVSDPHSLPRWWPRTTRVEDVRDPGGKRAHWTTVLETEKGKGVRADFHCIGSTNGERYAWEQDVQGTPFEKILKSATLEIGLRSDTGGTRVTLTAEEALRGLSRLGGSMMRGAARRRLDEALEGIERALVA